MVHTGKALTVAQKREKVLAAQNQGKVTKDEVTTVSGRSERIPLGVVRKKLDATPIQGKHLYWMNDDAGRISAALQGGYEFVNEKDTKVNDFVTPGNSDLGSQVKRLVGKDEFGSPLYAYLMQIDESLWAEDQASIQQQNDKIDNALIRGELNQFEGQYGSVKIN